MRQPAVSAGAASGVARAGPWPWELIGQAIRYGLIGFVNTAVSVGVMAAGGALGLHYALYSTLGYAVAVIVSFQLNRRLTFAAAGAGWQRFGAFIAVCFASLALAHVVQTAMIELAGATEPVGVFVGMVAYTVVGFFLNRSWVFRPHADVSTAAA